MKKLIESLSPNERKIIPFLDKPLKEICELSSLDSVSVTRALEYLKNKGIVELVSSEKKIIDVGVNGALYRKKGLQEKRLLDFLAGKRIASLEDTKKEAKLSDDELKAAIGALKKKALIELKNGKLSLNAGHEEVAKKSLEEHFLEQLPLDMASFSPEQQYAFNSLKQRRDIVIIEEKKTLKIKVTSLGKELMSSDLRGEDLIEQLTPEILKSEKNWKGKKFRRYDILSPVPQISGGKRHFVNQGMDYARKVWTEMGFKEMPGNLAQTGFWNFDALFTAQDHPVREIQDTFYIKDIKGILPKDKKNIQIVSDVKKSHETGVSGSKGWQYKWSEDEAKRVILRTHTTCLSAQTLASLRNLKSEDKRGKFFAVGKCFRNETVDWKHGFEFNQTEGIVVDRNANFKHLLGYLKSFF